MHAAQFRDKILTVKIFYDGPFNLGPWGYQVVIDVNVAVNPKVFFNQGEARLSFLQWWEHLIDLVLDFAFNTALCKEKLGLSKY